MKRKCSECEYAVARVMLRRGIGNSAYVGVFYQTAQVCYYPGYFNLFYGKTSPRDCPLKRRVGG